MILIAIFCMYLYPVPFFLYAFLNPILPAFLSLTFYIIRELISTFLYPATHFTFLEYGYII
jgi:hypothetical protein